MTISPERLAAYADNQLTGAEAAEVEAALATDPGLRKQLEAHLALKARLAAHFAPVLGEEAPERLASLLRKQPAAPTGTEVVDFTEAAKKMRARRFPVNWMRYAGPAIAASLVLALIGYGLRPSTPYASGEIAAVLDDQLVATQPEGAKVRVLLSFRDSSGDFCRGFAADALSGIACRDARGWRLEKVFAPDDNQVGEYRQAGSPDAATMAAIQDMAVGGALDAKGEIEARSKSWRK